MSSEKKSVVIVGAGQGGAQVAASLRDDGFDGRISLIGEESVAPYQRPPLSKGLLLGKQTEEDLWLRPAQFYDERSIDLILADRVRQIDHAARRVSTTSGLVLDFDHLVLATGARPRRLAVPGSDLDGVMYLRDLDDTRALIKQLAGSPLDVVVVGGGFVGLEAAASAAALGHRTTVLEAAGSLMPRVASNPVSDFFLAVHRRNGTRVLLNATATDFLGDRDVHAVRTGSGDVIPADVVLIGIGVVPATDIQGAPDLAGDGGILVDHSLRTSVDGVFAIGDCATFPCAQLAGKQTRLESVQNATDQARHVAAMISGRDGTGTYRDLPWFWSDQAGYKYQIAGLPGRSERVVILGSPASGRFTILHFVDGAFSFAESVNSAADHMFARRLLALDSCLTHRAAAESGFSLKGFYTAMRHT